MKNRLRVLAPILFLFSLLAASGCSEDVRPSSTDDSDLVQTILDIFAETDRFDRIEHLVSVLRGVSDDQASLLEEALNALDLPYREDLRILIVTEWAKHDPAAATIWVMNSEHVEFARSIMFDETTYLWARKDPASLIGNLRIVMYSSGTGWDPAMLRAMVRGWYDSGEPDLELYIYDLGRFADDRQRALSELIKVKLAREGIDPVIEWAQSLRPDRTYKKYAYGRVAGGIAKIDPARAAEWCEKICDSIYGTDVATWIASDWAVKDGAAAMDWIVGRPNSIASRVGARSAYRKFLRHAEEDAVAWMDSTTEEQRRGPVLQGPVVMYFNIRSARNHPLEAIEWSRYIQDEGELHEQLIINARRWLRMDKDAAEEWLAQSDISDEMKAYAYTKGRVPKGKKSARKGAKPKPVDEKATEAQQG